MHSKIVLIGLILLLVVSFGSAKQTKDIGSVPEAWLDSLAANRWRMQRDNISSYRMKVIANRVDKNGELKDSYTEYMYVEVIDGEPQEPIITDEAGVPVPEENKKKKREEKAKANPFGMFSKENRDNYQFKLLEPDDLGRIRIDCNPSKKIEEGFQGVTTIDTLSWVPVHIEGRPYPLPKMVKEMDMSMDIGPSQDGYFQINDMETQVVAKFLLMTFRMQMESTFYDYHYLNQDRIE